MLASFPRLTSTGTQHTTVETENVRYVYQPLEELYMVLITNRQSNILQDISTLHLFAQIVTSTCRSCNEAEIIRNAFDLISAFDEVCSHGYRENLTLPQIKNYLEMDSHEEKIQEIIERNKELEANEERKRRAKQLEQQRKELQKRGQSQSGGFGNTYTAPRYEAPAAPSTPVFESKLTKSASAPRGKGLMLGKKSKQADLFEAVRDEAEAIPLMVPAVQEEKPQKLPAVDTESIHIKVTETTAAKVNRDGGIESLEVKGDLTLLISDREKGQLKVLCALEEPQISGLQMKTHPNVDKAQWANSNTIALRDASRSFPIDTSIGVLRWRHTTVPASFSLPITVTCWPNVGSGTCDVTVEAEYTGTTPLSNICISIPLLNDQDPEIGESTVEATVNVTSSSNLEWCPLLTPDQASASLEFTCSADQADEFFPISVSYTSETSACGLEIIDVQVDATGQRYSKDLEYTATIQVV